MKHFNNATRTSSHYRDVFLTDVPLATVGPKSCSQLDLILPELKNKFYKLPEEEDGGGE